MVSRRQVLVTGGTGMAAVSLGLASGEALGVSRVLDVSNPAPVDLGLFVLDTSIPGADQLGDSVREARITSIHYSGDVGTPWLSHIEPLWRTQPQPIAGLTFGGAFFCLEHLARTYGLTCTLCSVPSALTQIRSLASPVSVGFGEAMLRAATIAPGGAQTSLGTSRVEESKPLLWRLQPKGWRSDVAQKTVNFTPSKTTDQG